jgi:hypothetical protein
MHILGKDNVSTRISVAFSTQHSFRWIRSEAYEGTQQL